MIRDFLAGQLGGLVLWVRTDRTIHHFDGATYRLELVWFRRRFGFDYHTPRHPRDVRRARAFERARLEQASREARLADAGKGRTAGEHRFVTGDIIPSWVEEIPDYVLEVRTGRGEVWSRPVGDQGYAVEDGEPLPEDPYPWVSLYYPRNGGTPQVAGWSSDEGLFSYEPITVTAVAVDRDSARDAA